MYGRGFDRLQPPWSQAAVAAAAKAAQAAAAEESEDSRNSEKFLLMHMHQWSRDSDTEVDVPPPPPPFEETISSVKEDRYQRRHSKGGSDAGRQQSKADRGGSSDSGRGMIVAVPEEVPIMRPGQERALQQHDHAGFWPPEYGEAGLRDMSTIFPASGQSAASSELLPWLQGLQGRMQLPPPPGATLPDYGNDDDEATDTGEHEAHGFEQGHFNIFVAPPPAPGIAAPAMPPAVPLGASPRASPRSSPRGLALPAPPPAMPRSPWSPRQAAEVALQPPDQGDAQFSSLPTFFSSLMPWRHLQHQVHEEETTATWEENPTAHPASQLRPAHATIPRRLPDALTYIHQDEPCPMPSPNPAHKADWLRLDLQSSVVSPLQVEAEVDFLSGGPDRALASNLSPAAVHPECARASRVSFKSEVEEVPATRVEETTPPGRGSVSSMHSLASLSRLLSPKRKEMMKMQTSFQANALPVYHEGKLFSKSDMSLKASRSWTSRLATCCRSCWETKSLMLPCCTLLLSLLFTCGLAVLLWVADTPDVTEGAFGLLCQTERGAPINFTYFQKAREHAIASLSVLENDEDATNAQRRFAMENTTRAWWRVEVLFFKSDGDLLTHQNVEAIRDIERKMMDLPGWKKLCGEKVPREAKQFCNPGDSFAAVAFGSNQPADGSDAAMGALSKVVYDGESSSLIMPLEQFIRYLKDFQQAALKRWFAVTGPQISKSPVRATYAFYLPQEDFEEWDVFVRDELEPLLHDEATKGDGANNDGTGYGDDEPGIRVFYRADGLKSKEFLRAVSQDAPLRFVACIAVLLSILLTSRRILLAFAGAVLSLTAPLSASTLAAGRGPEGNLEYPATTVAAWFIVAISCSELALATANAWEVKDTAPILPRCLQRFPGWHSGVYSLVRFILEVPTPTLGPAISLFLCGRVVDLPLVTEFTLHVSLGWASACFFGMLVFPPACEVGDRLRERALNSLVMNEMQESTYGLMPYELGGKPIIVERMETLMEHVIDAVSSKPIRIFALLVFLAVIVGASFEETSPLFVSAAPELFHDGHRLRVAPKVRELFGSSELLGQTGAPVETLKFARKCKPDAYDKLSCSWYKCEVDGYREIDEGKCSCFKQTVGKVSDIRKCGAVVRFASLPPGSDAFAKVTFWRWVEDQMGVLIVNNSISAWKMGTLEMESWATGLVTIEPQMVVQTHGADGRAPAWEDACMRVLCYCGRTQCKLDQTWWQYFGEPTITAPDRRLQTAANLVNGEREVEVYVVWGLAPTPEIPRKVIKTHYHFGTFKIENPWVQRNVHSFCHGLYPRLHVYESRCWALDFKRWLLSRGERFPVPAADFYSRFHHFVAHYADLHSQQPGRDTYDYFWLNRNGSIQGCYAMFKGSDSDNLGLERYRLLWGLYIFRRNVRNDKDTGNAWQASPQFAAHEAALAVKDAAKYTAGLSLICPLALTLFLTCSLGLTMAIMLIQVFALCILLCIAVGLGMRDFGPMEACGLATFTSMLVTPLIRIAHQYALTREGPGDPPKEEFEEANDNPLQFRPRSASIFGEPHANFKAAPIVVHIPRMEGQDEEYVVDNSLLQAKTCGLGYRLSPNLRDLDTKSRGYTGLAPWGSTVIGKRYLHDWIKVGERFLPVTLNNIPVLVLQPGEHLRPFSPAMSEADDWREDWKLFLFGPYDVVKIWRGAPKHERRCRTMRAVRRMSHTVLGVSIAGLIAAFGLLPMNMSALGKIGLAVLCAALTVPTAALGLLPMLAMTPFLGPSRVRRRAWAEFIEWLRQGRPRGNEEDKGTDHTSIVTGCAGDTQGVGEVSAEVLGFPFSVTTKRFVEHLPDSLQQMVGYSRKSYTRTAGPQPVKKPGRLRSES